MSQPKCRRCGGTVRELAFSAAGTRTFEYYDDGSRRLIDEDIEDAGLEGGYCDSCEVTLDCDDIEMPEAER